MSADALPVAHGAEDPGFVAESPRPSPLRAAGVRSVWARAARPVPVASYMVQGARIRPREVFADVVVMWAATAALLLWLYRPWDISLRVPFGYAADSLFYAMNTKSVVQGGWVQETARLGAPFGQALYDFPVGADNGNYLIIKSLGVASGDWALVINLFFLLQFFTTSLTSYVVCCLVGIGRRAGLVISVLFAFAPFHFLRLTHLMIAHYAVLPLGVLLALRAADGVALRSPGSSRWNVILWIAACACLGSFGAYWAVFSLITVAAAATISAAAHRTLRPLIAAGVVGAVTLIVLIANLAGTLLYQRANGSNTLVGRRIPLEMDVYGLRPIQLITPTPLTRLTFLRGTGRTLSTGYTSEGTMYLGVIFALVLVVMLVWLAVRVVRMDGKAGPPAARLLALLTVFWMLVATTGGFDWLVQLVSFDRIRGWNRSSILIEFLVAVWGGLVVAPWLARWVGRLRRPSVWATLLALVVVVVGIADQTGLASLAPRASNGVQLASDEDFFVGIEHELPTGSRPCSNFRCGAFPRSKRSNGPLTTTSCGHIWSRRTCGGAMAA